ncbi:MAG: FMN-binding negative transcriptional regulator [Saprospiraceae bacterium]|nr:FMN-binding negative transcriptional regulator [Saprospiraceae bacterium]
MDNHEEIMDFIKNNGFAILISVNTEGVPWATHIPIALEKNTEDAYVLRGHVSKANPHAQLLLEGSQVLVIFQGAHAYISSSWYTHDNVSTWNYSAVHIYGKVRVLSDEALWSSVESLTAKYESHVESPKMMTSISPDFLRKEIRGIHGFEVSIDDIHAKAKLSQNRKDVDYGRIIEELEKTEDGQAHEVARQMKEKRPL